MALLEGNFDWGEARFTAKKDGWQALCRNPLHRSPAGHVTCKKFKTGNVVGGGTRAVAMLKWWIVLGEEAQSRAQHQAAWATVAAATPEDWPTKAWLESKKPGQIMPEAEHIEVVEAHVDADAPADKRQRRS